MLINTEEVAQTVQHAMGTVISHKIYGMYAEDCLPAVIREIDWFENRLSRFLPESEVSRINRSAGRSDEKVSPETFELLTQAVAFSGVCPGAFDVTIGPLVDLWKIGKQSFVQPDDRSIEQALSLVNYRDLVLDPVELTAGLINAGQSIDLGGIGKGFAGDKILEVYRLFGIRSAYANLGGNVVTLGSKPDGSPWHVGVQHPRQQNRLIGSVAVIDQSVVTSGDYQRFTADRQGNRWHHILNPSTGFPTKSDLISVTIVSANSTTADALSTVLFITGLEKGIEIIKKSFPETEAILVDAEEQVFVTAGLKESFQPVEGIQVNIFEM